MTSCASPLSIFGSETSMYLSESVPWVQTHRPAPSPRRTPRTLAPNLSRRSHKKSRGGCLSCKARKIKCQETRPSCENCNFRALECVYPTIAQQKLIRRSSSSSSSKSTISPSRDARAGGGPPRSPSSSFSMEDMRCFHHFLTVAYPHLPLGNDDVWVRDVPVFAQQHEYLMHAILALGASHLTRVSDTDYSTAAIVHRGQAINGLNQAIAQGARGYGEADAMLAACYALTFQASYMGDGMADFVTMVRGCALVTEQIKSSQTPTAFNLERDLNLGLEEAQLAEPPSIDVTLLPPAVRSVDALGPLLHTQVEHDLHASMCSVLAALQESPQAGYAVFMRVYIAFQEMSPEQFNTLLDVGNITSQLLMAHFVALQLLVMPMTMHESRERAKHAKAPLSLGIVEWGEDIFARTPAHMHRYLEWPNALIQAVRREVEALDAGNYDSLDLKILHI